jgi:NAD-dependent DNA ligase
MCCEVIKERDGIVKGSVSKGLDYLVVGYFGSTDWIHTPYGRKIEYAADLREKHGSLAIVSEDHWAETVFK